MSILNLPGPNFLFVFIVGMIVLAVFTYTLQAIVRYTAGRKEIRPDLSLNPYETAYLLGGRHRAVSTAVAGLVQRGRLKFEYNRFRPEGDKPLKNDFEREVFEAADPHRGSSFNDLLSSVSKSEDAIRDRLLSEKCIAGPVGQALHESVPLMLTLVWFVIGVAKIIVGVQRNRPVTFLFLLLLGLGFCVVTMIVQRFRRWRDHTPIWSSKGKAAAEELKSKYAGLESDKDTQAVDVRTALAIFGVAVLAGGAMHGLSASLLDGVSAAGTFWPGFFETIQHSSVTSGGCGSSCGSSCGGGCGGGCGGCGGCGG